MLAKAKKLMGLGLRLAITIVILIVVMRGIDFQDFGKLWGDIAMIYLPVIALLMMVNRMLMAVRLRVLLGPHGDGSGRMLELVKVVYLSGFFGMIVPGGVGIDAVRMLYLQRQHGFAGGASVVLADRLIGCLAMTGMSLLGVLLTWQYLPEKQVGLVIVGFSIFVWLTSLSLLWKTTFRWWRRLVLGLFSMFSRHTRSEHRGRRILVKLDEAHLALEGLLGRLDILFKVFVLATTMLLLRVAIVVLLFRCIHVALPAYYAMAFVPMIFLLVLMPISFFGLGVSEGAFVYFFGVVGISASAALAASLIGQVLVQSVQVGGGLLFCFVGPNLKQLTKAADAEPEADADAPSAVNDQESNFSRVQAS